MIWLTWRPGGRLDSHMTPQEQIEYEKQVASLRAGMDEYMFSSLWAKGRTMTMEKVIAFALGIDSAG